MTTFFRKLLVVISGLALTLLILAPWIAYEVALSNIVELPTPPQTSSISSANAETIWRKFKEPGPIAVEALTPHKYIFDIITNNQFPPGAHIAWYVARNYNFKNLKNRRVFWWHLSGAALTIWLTRNWTTEQLIAKTYEISQSSQLSR